MGGTATLAIWHILWQPGRHEDQSCFRPPAWAPPQERGGAIALIGGGWRMRNITTHVSGRLYSLGSNMAEMETQNPGTEDGFTPVTHKGSRRAKKRQAGDASSMDTEEARPAKMPIFPPLSGERLLVGTEARRGGVGRPGEGSALVLSLVPPVSGHLLNVCVLCCRLKKKKREGFPSPLTDTHH